MEAPVGGVVPWRKQGDIAEKQERRACGERGRWGADKAHLAGAVRVGEGVEHGARMEVRVGQALGVQPGGGHQRAQRLREATAARALLALCTLACLRASENCCQVADDHAMGKLPAHALLVSAEAGGGQRSTAGAQAARTAALWSRGKVGVDSVLSRSCAGNPPLGLMMMVRACVARRRPLKQQVTALQSWPRGDHRTTLGSCA